MGVAGERFGGWYICDGGGNWGVGLEDVYIMRRRWEWRGGVGTAGKGFVRRVDHIFFLVFYVDLYEAAVKLECRCRLPRHLLR